MTRFDAVQYISHGIAKRPGMSEPRHVRGVDEDQAAEGEEKKARPGRAQHLLRQPQQEGARRQDRSADRPREGGAAHHPGALPAPEEQSAVRRRPRRRQDGDRGRPRPQDHQGRSPRGAAGRHHLRARHGRAAGRHALPRRFRGAAQGRDEGDRELSGRDPVHRRDPHRDRRRRNLRRRHGCVQPSEAGAAVGHRALHRLDHLQGVPAALREGPRARAPLPEDRREGADGRGHHRDPQGPEALLRELPQAQVHQRRHQGGGRALGQVHPRPQAARQGDRRDRRDGRLADAGAREQAQEEDRGEGDRGDGRHDGAHPAQDGDQERRRGPDQSPEGPQARRIRPGQGDRGARVRDQAVARGPARAGEADRLLPVLRARRASARPRSHASSRT